MFSISTVAVVDEDTDRERQTTQRHDVDRRAERIQPQNGAQDRKGNRDRDDQRRAQRPQKDQNHQRGQAGGDRRLENDALNRLLSRRLD